MNYKLLVSLTSALATLIGYQFYQSSTNVQTEKLYDQIMNQQMGSERQPSIGSSQTQINQEQLFNRFPKQWMEIDAKHHINLKIDQLDEQHIQGVLLINGNKHPFLADFQHIESGRIYQAEFNERLSKNKIIIRIDLIQPDLIEVEQIFRQTKEMIRYDLLPRK